MSSHNYTPYSALDVQEVTFSLGADRQGKATVRAHYKTAELAMLSPAAVTNWPRVTGDGNFGTMWGPTDMTKAKFTLDLTDAPINDEANPQWATFAAVLESIDEKLLDFVHANQLKLLARKNLTRDEVKMLQIRTVRAKYDKASGQLLGHSVQMSTSKYAYDGMGGKQARLIDVCDKDGQVVRGGNVCPGDVVAATTYVNLVYTGVGGDKFGIHWAFEAVQVVCQRASLPQRTQIPIFSESSYSFAEPYMKVDHAAQFEDVGV